MNVIGRVAMILLVATAMAQQSSQSEPEQTVVGYVRDSGCVHRFHEVVKPLPNGCVEACVRAGSPAFFEELLPRIKALPGVISATESLMLPPDEGAWTDVIIPGKPHSERWTTDLELCTERYFQTLGLTLLRGRFLVQDDVDAKTQVAVVNETLARSYFAEENPIGRRIKFEVFDRPFVDAPHNTYFEIVGVVADFKTRPEGTEYTLRPESFLPASTAAFGYPLHILARTSIAPPLPGKDLFAAGVGCRSRCSDQQSGIS